MVNPGTGTEHRKKKFAALNFSSSEIPKNVVGIFIDIIYNNVMIRSFVSRYILFDLLKSFRKNIFFSCYIPVFEENFGVKTCIVKFKLSHKIFSVYGFLFVTFLFFKIILYSYISLIILQYCFYFSRTNYLS